MRFRQASAQQQERVTHVLLLLQACAHFWSPGEWKYAVTPNGFGLHSVLKAPELGNIDNHEGLLIFLWQVVILSFKNISITLQCFTHHFLPQPKLPMRRWPAPVG